MTTIRLALLVTFSLFLSEWAHAGRHNYGRISERILQSQQSSEADLKSKWTASREEGTKQDIAAEKE